MNAEAPQTEARPPLAEFASVILTVDHTSARSDGHRVQKMVASSEDLVETMISLFKYYGDEAILTHASTINQFQEAGRSVFPCFLYRTPSGELQIVMSWATLQLLASREDSIRATVESILDTAGELIVANERAAGGPIPLTLFAFDVPPVQEAAPPPPKAKRPKQSTRRSR